MNLAVAAIGVSSSFGPTWHDARKAIAANETQLRRQRGFMGADFKPQLTCFTDLAGEGRLIGRLKALSLQALDDLFGQTEQLPPIDWRSGVQIALCGPDAQSHVTEAEMSELKQDIAARTHEAIAVPVSVPNVSANGPVGFVTLLDHFRTTLDDEKPLIIVTVDSYNTRDRLRTLGDAGQLFSDRSPYGLIPGEAAAAVLIEPRNRGLDTGFYIGGHGLGYDEITESDAGDSDYSAMAKACQAAVAPDQTFDRLFTNWNNNRYRAAEFSYAQLRMKGLQSANFETIHPSLTFGDLGAAFPGVALALARDMAMNSLVAITGGAQRHQRGAFSLFAHATTP